MSVSLYYYTYLSWTRRGEGEEYLNCVRTDPSEDLCNGFFVSVLERVPDHQQERYSLKACTFFVYERVRFLDCTEKRARQMRYENTK